MRLILSVYTTESYKEVLLPAGDHTDFTINLSKQAFGLREDLPLELEVVNHVWHFKKSKRFSARRQTEKLENEGTGRGGTHTERLSSGDVWTVETIWGEKLALVVTETEHPFSVFTKYDISQLDQITIGMDADNMIVYRFLSLVSRHHAVMRKEGTGAGGWLIEDISSNGIFLNEKRLSGSRRLFAGDCIVIYGLKLIYLEDKLAIHTVWNKLTMDPCILPMKHMAIAEQGLAVYDKERSVNTCSEEYLESEPRPREYFNRSPRNIMKLDEEPVEIEAAPAPKAMEKKPLFLIIGPSFTMAIPMLLGTLLAVYGSGRGGGSASVFMYTGIITVAGSAFLGVFWALVNLSYSKKTLAEEENRRFSAYSGYLVRQVELIKEKYDQSRKILGEMYPEAAVCVRYDRNSPALWGRNRSHEDFLEHRLGIGELPFQVPIVIQKERFSLVEDELMKQPAAVKKEYEKLFDVPVRVDLLKNRLVGVIGGEDMAGALDIMQLLTVQIAAGNCYTDVKLIYIYNESFHQEAWNFVKWLPHVWSEDHGTRYVASNKQEAGDIFYELAGILRRRTEQEQSFSNQKGLPKPYYVMFVADPSMLEGELISKYIYDCKEQAGLTTCIMAQDYDRLPNACSFVIEKSPSFSGWYEVDGDVRQPVRFDSITLPELEKFARRLSDIEVKEVEKGGDIPNSLTFFDMYHVHGLSELEADERWKKNRNYDSMRVPIGVKAGGELCCLDIHEKYHGPHGLVAGTTGSGKSETLQTYILSLALNFSPDDVGFFIIDYKGGGMANLFEGLPHMIGQVSNLSGGQVRRAMVSIKSENKRRQRIFNENNVNNINSYTKLYKSGEAKLPIPHLFIIIDEFAELKREESDFMKELISVAQVGRSLGVHLILATQKPNGTVDDNIWSNSKFRLCLRVQDRQDSNDMLHKPDAAYITQAGRCYLQVGSDELYELFQSAWSGAVWEEEEGEPLSRDEIATMITLTGHTALTGSNLKRKRQARRKLMWIHNLIQIMLQAAADRKMNFTDFANSLECVDAVYERLKYFGEDYPDNGYNRRRLEEMLKITSSMMEALGPEEGSRLERVAEQVIQFADQNHVRLPEKKVKTQLEAVVEYLAGIAELNGMRQTFQLWLPLLPSVLPIDSIKEYQDGVFGNGVWPRHREWSLQVPVGLCDDPVNQAQMPLVMDFAENGHQAVCGVVVSGKSTFLQTVVYALINCYSPEYVNLYLIDYSSRMMAAFEKAPHVGGVMYEEDEEKTSKFFHLLEEMLDERKRLFRGGNYSQYVKLNGVTEPSVIVAIDNYGGFREKTENRYDDMIVHISHEGAGYGIFLLLSAGGFGASEIQSKVGDNIKTAFCLQMNDKFQYSDILRATHLETLPEPGIKGRGLAVVGKRPLEFQTAVAVMADNDYDRIKAIEEVCEQMRFNWKKETARQIPVIPDKPVWSEYLQLYEVKRMLADDRHLPIGYDMESAGIYGIDLSRTYCYLISGRARTGKTNTMKALMQSASLKGGRVCVIGNSSDELEGTAKRLSAEYIAGAEKQSAFFGELLTIFKKRNGIKRSLKEAGREDEIYGTMREEESIYLFIPELAQFVNSVMNPPEGVTDIRPFVENMTEKGSDHNIYLFAGWNPDLAAPVQGLRVYENITGYRTGIHFGGNVVNVRVMDFSYLSYTEQSKGIKPGIGLLPIDNGGEVRRVVVPLVKGE